MAIDKLRLPAQQPPDKDELFHYYDRHPTKEDLMGESTAQSKLIFYLLKVFEWMYRVEGWFVISNLNIFLRRRVREYPLAPDVAVFKGVRIPNTGDRKLRSWRLYEPGRPRRRWSSRSAQRRPSERI
jgi:hypothetical protein